MELGVWTLVFGLLGFAALAYTPHRWLRLSGGMLILLTIGATAFQLASLAFAGR